MFDEQLPSLRSGRIVEDKATRTAKEEPWSRMCKRQDWAQRRQQTGLKEKGKKRGGKRERERAPNEHASQ